jgi:hypothetical protein
VHLELVLLSGGKHRLFCFALFVGCLVRSQKGCQQRICAGGGPFDIVGRICTIDRWEFVLLV